MHYFYFVLYVTISPKYIVETWYYLGICLHLGGGGLNWPAFLAYLSGDQYFKDYEIKKKTCFPCIGKNI